jgi:hypothetical protein
LPFPADPQSCPPRLARWGWRKGSKFPIPAYVWQTGVGVDPRFIQCGRWLVPLGRSEISRCISPHLSHAAGTGDHHPECGPMCLLGAVVTLLI